jgi:hypothetical protein
MEENEIDWGCSVETGPRRHRPAVVAMGALLVLLFSAEPAAAHEGEQSTEASDLIRQAIALIVNTPNDTMAIEDKINDAINANDKTGVDIAPVQQANDALEAGDLHRARALLEVSIGAQPHLSSALPVDIGKAPAAPGAAPSGVNLATGDNPGGGLADDPLVASRHFDGRTSTMLAVSIALVVVGVVLAIRYRPLRKNPLLPSETP